MSSSRRLSGGGPAGSRQQQQQQQRRHAPMSALEDPVSDLSSSDEDDDHNHVTGSMLMVDAPSTIGGISTVTQSRASSIASHSDTTTSDGDGPYRPHRRGASIQQQQQTIATADRAHATITASNRYQAIAEVCSSSGRISYTVFCQLLKRCHINADESTVNEHFARAIGHDAECVYAPADKVAHEIYALGGTVARRDPNSNRANKAPAASSPTPADSSDWLHREPIDSTATAGGGTATTDPYAAPDTSAPRQRRPMRFGGKDPLHEYDNQIGTSDIAAELLLVRRQGANPPPKVTARAPSPQERNAERAKRGLQQSVLKLSVNETTNLVNRLTRRKPTSQKSQEAKIAVQERREKERATTDEECTFHPAVADRSRALSQRAIGDGTCREADRFRRPTESYYARQAERSTHHGPTTCGDPGPDSFAMQFRRSDVGVTPRRVGAASSSASPSRGRSLDRKPIPRPAETPNRRINSSRTVAPYDENHGAVTSVDCTFKPSINASPRKPSPTHVPKGYNEAILRMRRTPSSRGSSPNARFNESLRSAPPSPLRGGSPLQKRAKSTFGNERYVDPHLHRFAPEHLATYSAASSRSPPRVAAGQRLDHAVEDAVQTLVELFGPNIEEEMGAPGWLSAALAPPTSSSSTTDSNAGGDAANNASFASSGNSKSQSRRRSSQDPSTTKRRPLYDMSQRVRNQHDSSVSSITSGSGRRQPEHSFRPAKISSRAYIQAAVDSGRLDPEDACLARAAFTTIQNAILVKHHEPVLVPRRETHHERVVFNSTSPRRARSRYGVDPNATTMSARVAGVPRYATPTRAMSPHSIPTY